MTAVAERLVCRVPATAEGNYRPAGQAELLSLHVANLKVSFKPQGTVVEWRDFN
jgi:hypothetical protein